MTTSPDPGGARRVPLSERLGRFAARARAAGCELELHHVSRGLVVRVERGEETDGAALEQIADDHASALHGRQGYELRAVFPEGGVKQTLPFRVQGDASADDALDEPGDAGTVAMRQVIATLQKQNERLLTANERKDRPMVDALETLGAMVSKFMAQQDSLFVERLQIASLQAEREEAQRRDVLAEKKWHTAMARFGPVFDAVVAKVLPAAAPREDLLLRLAETLTTTQKEAIFAILEADQLELFRAKKWQELMASVLDRHLDRVVPLLRPEQVALLDAMSGAPKAGA